MRKILIISFYLMFSVAFGQGAQDVLIFIDKTQSVDFQKSMQERGFYQKSWDEIIGKLSHRDRLGIGFINANSGLPLFLDEQLPEEVKPKGATMLEEKVAKGKSKKLLDEKQQFIKQKFEEAITQNYHPQTSRKTNIWVSIEAASRYFAQTADATKKKFVIFSDMIEDTENCRLKVIGNRQQAEYQAKQDVGKIQKIYKINLQALRNVSVECWLTYPNNTPVKPEIKYYWEALMNGLGITNIKWI